MIFHSIHEAIGRTPLVRLETDAPEGVEVYAKLELQNPFGMKDRVARHILLEARRLGTLRPGARVVESSSGTMALGVALVGRALGHPVHIVTDPRIDSLTLTKLRALGCEVDVVETMNGQGWQGARLDRLARVLARDPDAFWPQQYTNPDNPAAYRALAAEILDDLGPIDTLVGAVGSGGSLCGTTRALRRTLPDLRAVGVDCVGSALFGQPDRPGRLQSGLGNSLLPANLDRRLIQEVHWLNDHEAFAATRDLAREQQIFAGNTSGSVYRVLQDLARRSAPGSRVVGIFPDRGDRYAGTVYDDRYWADHQVGSLPARRTCEQVGRGTNVRSWSRADTEPAAGARRHLLFVESNTTGTGMTALKTARRLGLDPVLLTHDPDRYAGLDPADCDIVVCDTNSPTGLRRTVQERFRREDIHGVSTTSEFYVPAVADLADWLGLPGSTTGAVAACRNKAGLRETLHRHGVHQPRFAVLDATAGLPEAAAAARTVGLPCVVKPVDDSGSHHVLLCATAEEVLAHTRRILAATTNSRGQSTARSVLVEEYLTGPEYSVEMFSTPRGDTCVGITEKRVTDGPHFVEYQHAFPAPLPTATAHEAQQAVRRALDAVGPLHGATHTEIKLTPAGPAVIEINPRPAGGMIPELIRLAHGTDLLEQQIRAAAGLTTTLEPRTAGHAGIRFFLAERAGPLRAVEGAARARTLPGVHEVRVTAPLGSHVEPAHDAYGRLGHVIAQGDSPAHVRHRLDRAHQTVRFRVGTHHATPGDTAP
ncbi:ATP-grasp domain-containing protein [Streptomyces katrae]|uniref:ATP-grasp domain-containing protein n=1 Tax=Streptomyces katrae TaxID=68223 RepID=A0ABT7GR75_9ACTN|nr:pyridoxal-phosphate dependent enzyme [Streptomyces katrae]MDK9496103.1 ATP-grasp domain-containing protein [Streptomyces katrae]